MIEVKDSSINAISRPGDDSTINILNVAASDGVIKVAIYVYLTAHTAGELRADVEINDSFNSFYTRHIYAGEQAHEVLNMGIDLASTQHNPSEVGKMACSNAIIEYVTKDKLEMCAAH
jgi:hypothetical protein